MEALKLIIADLKIGASEMIDRRQCMGIVGRELGEDEISPGKQSLGAGKITDIRIRLARVDRIAAEPVHLRAFYFAVPISALDEADHKAALRAFCQGKKIIDHKRCALLVGLDDKAKPLPAAKRALIRQPLKQIERWLQAIGFLGVDVESN